LTHLCSIVAHLDVPGLSKSHPSITISATQSAGKLRDAQPWGVLQDTPGTHIPGVDAAILKHILKQSRDYMSQEENPRRVVPLSNLPDPRVDVALVFLSPHYLKPGDVELMTKLAKFVPVVPIIAKVHCSLPFHPLLPVLITADLTRA